MNKIVLFLTIMLDLIWLTLCLTLGGGEILVWFFPSLSLRTGIVISVFIQIVCMVIFYLTAIEGDV